MEGYRHILAAVEAQEDDGPRVLHHAWGLAQRFEARLSLVHVVEYLPVDPAGDALLATPLDLTHERREQAQKTLDGWCTDAGITVADTWVTVGSITQEILRARGESGADLIVIGSHQKGWLKRLLEGSESADMIREAPCAVFVATKAHKERLGKE